MQAKKAIIILIGLGLLAGSTSWLYKEKKKSEPKKPDAEPETEKQEEKPVENTSAQSPKQAAPPVKKAVKKVLSTAPNAAPITKPKPVSADALLQSKGENAIYNKLLIAKNTGAGIYDTTNKKVSTTNAGEQLGKAYKAERTSAGNWLIKYQDWAGSYRMVVSSSVNVL